MLVLEDQVAFVSVVDMLLELSLDLEGRWPGAAWDLYVFSLLVKDAKCRCRFRIVFLFQWNYLQHVGVSHSDVHCMRQDDCVTVRVLSYQWDDLDDVVVEHERNEVSSLA